MTKMFYYLIYLFVSFNAVAFSHQIETTNIENFYDDLNDLNQLKDFDIDIEKEVPLINQATTPTNDYSYQIPDFLLETETTTTKPIEYQFQDLYESTTNNNNYDYEFVLDPLYAKDEIKVDSQAKDIIYVPIDYSIELINEKVEYSSTKPTTLATIILNAITNSTLKFNSTKAYFNHTNIALNQKNSSILFNSSLINSTQHLLANLTFPAFNQTILSNRTNQTIVTTTVKNQNKTNNMTEKKVFSEKTLLKLQSSFDEMYDIDAIPRKHASHLIEKRIHSHNEKMNTKGR